MSHLVLLQSVVFCLVVHTAERNPSAGERRHCTGQRAGSEDETDKHTFANPAKFTELHFRVPSDFNFVLTP